MKKLFFIIFVLFFTIPAFADVMPYYIKAVPKSAIGMYQTDNCMTIYSKPDKNSSIKKQFNFTYKPETMPDEVFGLLLNERKLGLLYVTDIGDDNWVEVIYNKKSGEKGWVQTEDKFQFLPWINFYNMYGRKYGLRLFKDAPDNVEILRSGSDDNSQSVGKMNLVQKIKLTAIRGNWALVSVYDLDKTPKMGFMRWRSNDGTIYAFPNIK